MTFNRLPRQAA